MADEFIIREDGDGRGSQPMFYVAAAQGEEDVMYGWDTNPAEATGFDSFEAVAEAEYFIASEGGYDNLRIIERAAAQRDFDTVQAVREAEQAARNEMSAKLADRGNWFKEDGARTLNFFKQSKPERHSVLKGGPAMNGFWQSARNFFTGREAETTTPALTPEGAALGFEWNVSAGKHGSALLWPQGPEAMETGPLAAVDQRHPAAGWTINGSNPDEGLDRDEAMNIAEDNAAARIIEPLAEASESYYAKLADLAESRGATVDRDVSGDSFDMER